MKFIGIKEKNGTETLVNINEIVLINEVKTKSEQKTEIVLTGHLVVRTALTVDEVIIEIETCENRERIKKSNDFVVDFNYVYEQLGSLLTPT